MSDHLAALRAKLEGRAVEAEAMRSTAAVADTLRWVLGELAAVNGNGKQVPSNLLTVREAAGVLKVTPRWLYRHAGALPFTRRLGPKTMRFDAEGLAKWAAKV